MGSRGMPRRYYDYLPQFEPFHKASTHAVTILGDRRLDHGSMRFIEALWKGKKAPRNWGGVLPPTSG